MFSNYFFLILLLALLGGVPGANLRSILSIPSLSLLPLLGLYTCLCALLYLSAVRWKGSQERFIFLANLLLLFCAGCFPIQHLFSATPLPQFLLTSSALFLYFSGLQVVHFGLERQRSAKKLAFASAWDAVRFLLPLTFPYLLFLLISDLAALLPMAQLARAWHIQNRALFKAAVSMALLLTSLLLTILFLPPIIVYTWGCQPIGNNALEEKLKQICQKAGFVHAGFRRWTIMGDALNAAILGMVGRFRYIMFTDALLHHLTPATLCAVLAHEIGHSTRKHLLFYPFIFAAILLLATSASQLFSDAPFLLITAFICTLALGFRYLFGHFSRLFERQADLQVFTLGIPPTDMVQALRQTSSPANRATPNWHHYSVQQRIAFIQAAADNPCLISQHHRKVRLHLIALFLLLGAAGLKLLFY